MARVQFNFRDTRGRLTSRSVVHTSNVIATILADIATLAPLWDTITDLGLENVTISLTDDADAFASAGVSNVDENVSVKVLAADGFKYDFDLPDMPDAFTPVELLDVTNPDVVAFFDQFGPASPWRINLRNPTAIVSLISGRLDK